VIRRFSLVRRGAAELIRLLWTWALTDAPWRAGRDRCRSRSLVNADLAARDHTPVRGLSANRALPPSTGSHYRRGLTFFGRGRHSYVKYIDAHLEQDVLRRGTVLAVRRDAKLPGTELQLHL